MPLGRVVAQPVRRWQTYDAEIVGLLGAVRAISTRRSRRGARTRGVWDARAGCTRRAIRSVVEPCREPMPKSITVARLHENARRRLGAASIQAVPLSLSVLERDWVAHANRHCSGLSVLEIRQLDGRCPCAMTLCEKLKSGGFLGDVLVVR